PAQSPHTFLFTDVEGSTRLWEAHPDAMRDALGEHFRILNGAIEAGEGTLVSDTGDGVFAVFPAARLGVGAAVAMQRALGAASWGATGPLRVRMGLHTGHADRGHEDFHGTEVNRCARLMATAHGGQVIVSEATYVLVRDDAPTDVSFLDLGEHRLKDLARPERIHQVVHRDLAAEFPPLRSLSAFPNNLPAELSSFIGRAGELAAVQDALTRARLVTLTGAGGAGKTRLALQVAADRIERHPDGVWLVDLAGLADPDLLTQAVLSALHVPELPGRPALDVLTTYLASRDVLVVLDNCEHLIAAAADVVDAVLRAAPKAKFIATSREPLNVPGEISWRVPSLSLPEEAGAEGADGSEAVALFVERARAVDPAFGLTPEGQEVVATITRRLDGLPLAIELAAARVRALSLEVIAARLQDRFSLLTGGARTALPRQRTLEAAVAWSYDLLDENERRLFARLSIFAGSFDLAAVEAVCSGDPIRREEILDLLTRLVDKSLVSVVHPGGATRYRLLETLRDYARNRLAASPDPHAMHDAHTRWAVAFAESAGAQLMGPDQARWLQEIAASRDDLRAALARTIDAGDPESGLRIMVGLTTMWQVAGTREARGWLEQLLEREDAVSPGLLGRGLSLYGVTLAIHGLRNRSADVQERALALLRDVGDVRGAAWATHYLGIERWGSSRPEEVKELTLEALAAFEHLDEPIGILRCLWWLILWELEFGDVDEALRHGARLQQMASRMPGPIGRAHAAEAAGLLARVQGDLETAGQRLREAVGLHVMIRNIICLSHCLEHVALWTLDRGDPQEAATLLGAVDAIREDLIGSTAVPGFERMWHDRATSDARAALGDEDYATAWGQGRAMNIDQAIAAGVGAVGMERDQRA
ncbi:MAG: adenylate/guanylate cyclase domain-containing protein, partial [Chloroflexota bacterium]|nr:adenylate/guanylate cyclase domain-containing protein [Chloroflexota bacterium]